MELSIVIFSDATMKILSYALDNIQIYYMKAVSLVMQKKSI